jgi:hypothetical protein
MSAHHDRLIQTIVDLLKLDNEQTKRMKTVFADGLERIDANLKTEIELMLQNSSAFLNPLQQNTFQFHIGQFRRNWFVVPEDWK